MVNACYKKYILPASFLNAPTFRRQSLLTCHLWNLQASFVTSLQPRKYSKHRHQLNMYESMPWLEICILTLTIRYDDAKCDFSWAVGILP